MVDVSILQRSLAILESMVLNSQTLYQKIAEEITVGQLISHLQVWVPTQQCCDLYHFYDYLFILKYVLLHLEYFTIVNYFLSITNMTAYLNFKISNGFFLKSEILEKYVLYSGSTWAHECWTKIFTLK